MPEGQVCDDPEPLARKRDAQGIRVHDGHRRLGAEASAKSRHERAVDLDGVNARSAPSQLEREHPVAGSELDDDVAFRHAGLADEIGS